MAAAVETDRSPDLIFLLSQAAHALQTEMTAALEQVGVTPRMQCVLSRALHGEFTQKDLADQCALDKTTMVVTMDALEQAGLAERRPSPTDRRARIIAVTDKGAEVSRQSDAIIAGVYADVLSSLPDGEREPFVGALQRLMEGRLANPAVCQTTVRRPRSS